MGLDATKEDEVIKVVENYILGDIKYEGNRKIKESKFKEELGLTRGQRLKPNTLHITKNRIEKLYAEKGYLNVEVRPSLLAPDNKTEMKVNDIYCYLAKMLYWLYFTIIE